MNVFRIGIWRVCSCLLKADYLQISVALLMQTVGPKTTSHMALLIKTRSKDALRTRWALSSAILSRPTNLRSKSELANSMENQVSLQKHRLSNLRSLTPRAKCAKPLVPNTTTKLFGLRCRQGWRWVRAMGRAKLSWDARILGHSPVRRIIRALVESCCDQEQLVRTIWRRHRLRIKRIAIKQRCAVVNTRHPRSWSVS